MDMFTTIQNNSIAEIVQKKSRFIAELYYVESEAEAEAVLEKIKKKYNDARHHCYAYRFLECGVIVDRFSDDGEPLGTAGTPMLNILRGKELVNVIGIVTRYFGGTLLGTGGLVRAYSESLTNAINNAIIIKKELGIEIRISVEYSDIDKVKYYIKQINGIITDINYNENVELIILIPEKEKEKFTNKYENSTFKLLKCDIITRKYIDISIV